LEELKEAIKNNDLKETIDALTDILYLANLFVINERTPCLSLTSNLKYKELT
jgi:hypothetical protein